MFFILNSLCFVYSVLAGLLHSTVFFKILRIFSQSYSDICHVPKVIFMIPWRQIFLKNMSGFGEECV